MQESPVAKWCRDGEIEGKTEIQRKDEDDGKIGHLRGFFFFFSAQAINHSINLNPFHEFISDSLLPAPDTYLQFCLLLLFCSFQQLKHVIDPNRITLLVEPLAITQPFSVKGSFKQLQRLPRTREAAGLHGLYSPTFHDGTKRLTISLTISKTFQNRQCDTTGMNTSALRRGWTTC